MWNAISLIFILKIKQKLFKTANQLCAAVPKGREEGSSHILASVPLLPQKWQCASQPHMLICKWHLPQGSASVTVDCSVTLEDPSSTQTSHQLATALSFLLHKHIWVKHYTKEETLQSALWLCAKTDDLCCYCARCFLHDLPPHKNMPLEEGTFLFTKCLLSFLFYDVITQYLAWHVLDTQLILETELMFE